MATIVIERDAAVWRDRYGFYRVMIDGTFAEAIRNGEERRFSVSPGHHRVQVRSGLLRWFGSRETETDLADDATATFHARSGGTAIGALIAFLRPKSYIELDGPSVT